MHPEDLSGEKNSGNQ